MRRAVPSFTVEVRRRPRLAITSNRGAQPSQSKPPQSAFDRATYGPAATAFGVKETDSSPVDVAASHPKGRILPSLVPEEPRHRLHKDAPVSAADSEPRAPKRPSVRALERGDQASKSPRNSSSADEKPPLAEGSSIKSHRASSLRLMKGQAQRQRTQRVRQRQVKETHAVSC
jgi:hypothetical protein